MVEIFNVGIISFHLLDLVDILLFSFIFYKLYNVVKDSRATTMFLGLLTVMLFGTVVELFDLAIMSWLMTSIKTIFWLAFFILFQPELRRILTHIGQNRIIKQFLQIKEAGTFFDEVAKAAFMLSDRRIGALIVLQKNVGIKNVIESGKPIKSDLTAELIVTIFNPSSPLHDGAVVVNNDQIVAAKCMLPATAKDIGGQFGTRHRAAVGMSEESDAIVVVVSEETGDVRTAYDGELLLMEKEEKLKNRLELLFTQEKGKDE